MPLFAQVGDKVLVNLAAGYKNLYVLGGYQRRFLR